MTLFQIVLVITKQSQKKSGGIGLQIAAYCRLLSFYVTWVISPEPFEQDTRDEGHCYGYDLLQKIIIFEILVQVAWCQCRLPQPGLGNSRSLTCYPKMLKMPYLTPWWKLFGYHSLIRPYLQSIVKLDFALKNHQLFQLGKNRLTWNSCSKWYIDRWELKTKQHKLLVTYFCF